MNIFLRFTLIGISVFFLTCNSDSVRNDKKSNTEQLSTTPEETVIRQLDELILKSPDSARYYELRGDAFLKMEGFDEAIADYTMAMETDEEDPIYPQKLAAVYMSYGRSRKAYNIMSAASFKFPDNLPLLLKFAEYQIILKKNNEAFQTLQKILKIDRHNAEAYFMMGVNFKDTGEIDKAISSLQTAVDKDSDFVDAWMMLGYIYDQKNDPLAERFFNNAIDSDPNFMDAYLAKGNHYGSRGDFSKAIETFKSINNKIGRNPDAFFNIGLSYFQMDSLSQAKENFTICTQVQPTYSKAYFYIGLCSEKSGNKEEAKNYYQQALNLDPELKRAEDALRALE